MFSKVLFFWMKILFVGFFYIERMAGHVVENYSKSLQKLEDGIIRVQLAIRVIFQELKCLCHTSPRRTYYPFRKKQEIVSHPVNEWNIVSARNV